MTRGRKPASPKVTDITDGRLTVIDGGGKPPAAPPPDAPDWIKSERGRGAWAQLIPDLLRRKQYLRLFEIELGRYCVSFGEYVAAQEAIESYGLVVKTPNGFPIQSPYVTIRNRQHEIMLRLAADLGFNPVAQMRMDGVQLDFFVDGIPPAGGESDDAPATGFAKFR